MRFPPPQAPMLPVAAAIAIGIAAAAVFELWGTVVGLIILISALLTKKLYLAGLGFITLTGAIIFVASIPEDNIIFSNSGMFSGEVSEIKDVVSSRILTVEIDSVNGRRIERTKVEIVIPSINPEIVIGSRIGFGGALNKLSIRRDLPDEITPEEISYRKGVRRTGVVISDSIHYVDNGSGLKWWCNRMKDKLMVALMNSNMSDNSKDFFAATLLGDTTFITEKRRDSFSASGIAHILALSGLHVGIIGLLLGIVLLPIRFFRLKWLYSIAVLAGFWTFAMITGLSDSVLRATVMATVYSAGRVIQRKSDPVNSLALAAFIILLFKPNDLFEPGFQMSFASVFGIILFYNELNFGKGRNWFIDGLASIIAVSVSAMLGSVIIVAYYFHEIPLLFLPANILIVPVLLPVSLGVSVLIIIIGMLTGSTPEWLSVAADHLVDMIDLTAVAVSKISFGVVKTGEIGLITIITFICALTLLKLFLKKQRPIWGLCMMFMMSVCVLSCEAEKMSSKGSEIYVISHSPRSTEVVVREDKNLYIMTTAIEGDTAKIADSLRKRYSKYMRKRSMENLTILPESFESGRVTKREYFLKVGEKTILLLGRKSTQNGFPRETEKLDYLIIDPSFRGSIEEVLSKKHCDKIIDLRKKRK